MCTLFFCVYNKSYLLPYRTGVILSVGPKIERSLQLTEHQVQNLSTNSQRRETTTYYQCDLSMS